MASGSVVTFLPIQEGEGTTSPTNVRPLHPPLYIDGIGEIWGGSLNPMTGELVSAYYKYVLKHDSGMNNSYGRYYKSLPNNANYLINTAVTSYSDKYAYRSFILDSSPKGFYTLQTRSIIMTAPNDDFETGDIPSLVEWLKDNPITFVLPLATPKTYTLTAPQLQQAIQQLGLQMPSALEMRRRVMLAQSSEWRGDVLPHGYTRVEYIRNGAGKAYIDTGLIIDDECKIVIDFFVASTGYNKSLFGWRRSGSYVSGYQLYLSSNNGNNLMTAGVGASGNRQDFQNDQRTKIIIDIKGGTININGVYMSSSLFDFSRGKAFNANGSAEYPAYIFAFNNIGTTTADASRAWWTRLYEYKVYKNEKLIQNLVPCRDENGILGVYDTIGKTFKTSPNGDPFSLAE